MIYYMSMPNLIYSKELLEPLVKTSVSYRQILKKLGKKQAGGTQANIVRKIKQYKIDTSHMLGQASNRGNHHVGGFPKRSADNILILRTEGYRQRHIYLKRALLEIGRKYKCYLCGLDQWYGKRITLEVEHKNGNPRDDRRENLEFICPNCHSQTDTYCRKKRQLSPTAEAAGLEPAQ
jgi:hypothetical protein